MVHIWPDASRMVCFHVLCGRVHSPLTLSSSTAGMPRLGVVLCAAHVMICDLVAAACRSPPGCITFGVFAGDSEAVRPAVGLCVASCLVQRRVAELERNAHWLNS